MAKINTEGDHDVTVQTIEVGESSKGTPQIYLFFVNEAGSIPGWLYLSEKAFERTVKTLREVFGFDGNFETIEEQVKDKPCSITVEIEVDDNGNEKPRVKWINAQGGGYKSKPLSDASNFLKTLTAKAKRIPAEAPKAAGSAPKAAPARTAAPAARPPRAAAPAKSEDPY